MSGGVTEVGDLNGNDGADGDQQNRHQPGGAAWPRQWGRHG
jgi:hypothetical protein